MYLNIGKNAIVPEQTVIGIFDLDICSQSYLTREFLSSAEKAGRVVNAAEDIPNSFLICLEGGEEKVLLAQSTSRTLEKRINQLHTERRNTWRKSTI
ncbi:MAG: DUF370 domain-containing protein [Oscillospiraceae bacterium]|nr:DUF370 domain-containing protein [Oscillospiraceae bacterium]